MHIQRVIPFLLFGLFITTQVQASHWWQEPPADNEQYLYGLGQGNTLAEAQQQALADISGKLSTSISASLDRVTQDTGIAYNDSVRRQIRSELKDIELSQFQLVKNRTEKTQTIALVQLDRTKLASLWSNQISEATNKLSSLLQTKTITDYQQWAELKKSLAFAEQSRNLSIRLFALNGTQPGPDFHYAIEQLLKKHPMKVALKGSIPQLNRALLQQFKQSGFVSCSSNCNLTISYQDSTTHDLMFGEYLSSLKVIYEVYERQSLIATSEKSVQVTSVSSHSSADEGSVSALVKDLQNRGLFEVVGLEL
ncbi:LPP20 family lipoprotein [Rheinheimera mangrovi]|uniref:LPP20 family lipoprotein n=1 Tax=Rheinheimera mangrovi TaxID=2498451 RepID=UPI000F8CDB13|nr:LPP20 family lipoprotein [Rheinheimera mangrovi]